MLGSMRAAPAVVGLWIPMTLIKCLELDLLRSTKQISICSTIGHFLLLYRFSHWWWEFQFFNQINTIPQRKFFSVQWYEHMRWNEMWMTVSFRTTVGKGMAVGYTCIRLGRLERVSTSTLRSRSVSKIWPVFCVVVDKKQIGSGDCGLWWVWMDTFGGAASAGSTHVLK